MWKEFKKFAFRGNVIDLAVGVMIGGAFGSIVTSLVNDIFMPLITLLTGALSAQGVNIESMQSQSRKDYAYTILDVSGKVEPGISEKLEENEGIVRARVLPAR